MEQRLAGIGHMTSSAGPRLAVVTISWNDAAGLRSTLESLAAQDVELEEFEHVVVDGASTDDTLDVLAQHALPTTKVISEPDNGVYDAMNKGLRETSAPYVQFLNSGDTLHSSHALATVIDHLDTGASWLVGRAHHLHGGVGNPTEIANYPHVWYRHALGLQPHCHQACIFSRMLLNTLGGHSERFGFGGDFDLILRAGLISAPVHIDAVLVDYLGGGLSAQKSNEIPALLGRIRNERLSLSGSAQFLNHAFVAWRQIRHRLHIWRISIRS
jgi:glycosyltransferase involved in cell wall biosynthesis